MGNPGKQQNQRKPKYDPSIQHFSHEHQLELLNTKDQPTLNTVPCAGCKLRPSEWVYACKPCNFILHIPCSKMPKLIHHPADPNHTFTLLAKPTYPTGLFGCDACGNDGDGFNYHCSTCGIDIHILCATMPLSLTHQTHRCPLNLTFSPPYPSKDFSCDVCGGHGANHWVYRCDPCGYDAHLNCATTKQPSSCPSAPSVSSKYQTQTPSAPSVTSQYQTQTRSLVHPQPQIPLYQQPQPQSPLYQQPQLQSPLPPQQYFQPASISTADQARQNFVQSFMAAQQADQARMLSILQNGNGAAMQSLIAGNNSATTAITQQYLQSMLGGNTSGINSMAQQFMGGGQQAGPNILASIMGGNGGGAGQQYNQDIMQNLLGGGGGGVQDILQNIMGGGGGGGLGLDGASSLLQNMFGGF